MICLNGQLVHDNAAMVSVFDRGFLYGDGLFETIPVYGGTPFLLDAHLQRLLDSAVALRFVSAPSLEQWKQAVSAVISADQIDCAILRLWMSRGTNTGTGLSCSAATTPTWVAACLPARRYPPHLYAKGAALFAVDRVHALPGQLPTASKHANYLASILAFDDAHANGADEALLRTPNGDVSEGAYSNLFFVVEDTLITPPLSDGPLAGIARACMLDLAPKIGLSVAERSVSGSSLAAVDEVFMTNSLIGIAPVRGIADKDGTTIDFQTPGPMTQRMSAAYADLVHEQTGFRWPLLA